MAFIITDNHAPMPRKLVLLVHITTSTGWLGAVAAFLVLAIAGLNSPDEGTVRSVYLVMPMLTWSVIAPSAFAALFTGLALSLGTKWGLTRYYWVLAKLLINSLAIPILLLHTRIISEVANAAAKGNLSPAELRGPRVQLVVVAVAALLALLAASALSVYKPRGMTPFNISRRKIVD
jgi:hypothetical protein